MFVWNKLCFVQLKNRLNMERAQLLKAQERSLLARHQHKDIVIQKVAELQSDDHQSLKSDSETGAVVPTTRHEMLRTDVHHGISVAGAADHPVSSFVTTSVACDVSSTRGQNAHRPQTFRVYRSASSSGYSGESSGCRIPCHSNSSASQHADNLLNHRHQSCSLPLRSNITVSRTEENNFVRRSLTLNNLSGNGQPVNCPRMEHGLPLVYMPPLTATVTTVSPLLVKSQSNPPHLPKSNAASCHIVGISGTAEGVVKSSSIPMTKANCVFASKKTIATTYLRRRPPAVGSVHVGTRSGSVDGELQADSTSVQSNVCVSRCDAVSLMTPSHSKQHSVAKLSSNTVASPSVPPRLSTSKHHQTLSQASAATPPADIHHGRETISSDTSALTFAVASSNFLPSVMSCRSAFELSNVSCATDVSSLSLPSFVCTPEIDASKSYSSPLMSSPLSTTLSVSTASEQLSPPTTDSSYETALTMPQVSVSSISLSSFHTNTSLSSDLVTVTTLSQVNMVSQPTMSLAASANDVPLPVTVEDVSCTMPCTLTIATHAPVSAGCINTVNLSLPVTLSPDVVDDPVVVESSSSDLMNSYSATAFVSNVSLVESSSDATGEMVETAADEVFDDCLPLGVQDLPFMPELCTSSLSVTSCQLSSDDVNERCHFFSPLSCDGLHSDASDLLKQSDIDTVVEKPAIEHNEVVCSSAEPGEIETSDDDNDASSDIEPLEGEPDPIPVTQTLYMKKKRNSGDKTLQRVSFSPLALLLDASLEGDLELVKNTVQKVSLLYF